MEWFILSSKFRGVEIDRPMVWHTQCALPRPHPDLLRNLSNYP
jgi:hypothetical protein